MKRYYALKDNGQKENFLKAELYYSKGGLNVWTYKTEPRGYYLSVTPVERGNGMEGFTMFTGIKILVKEVSRKSEKAEAEAEAMFDQVVWELINAVLSKYGYELETE